jgi:hypothetical protein
MADGRYGRHSGHWSELALSATVVNDPFPDMRAAEQKRRETAKTSGGGIGRWRFVSIVPGRRRLGQRNWWSFRLVRRGYADSLFASSHNNASYTMPRQ